MILDTIVKQVKQRVAEQQTVFPLAKLRDEIGNIPEADSFKKALQRPEIQVIAEIKKASPSAGIICDHFDPQAIAREYGEAGAAAISVLTEQDFFQGSLDILSRVREAVMLPLLRKDFLIDPYQIYQARYYGANCVLLIAAILSEQQLAQFQQLAGDLGMNALVEVHNEDELEKVLQVGADIIGINNRNLQTFRVDVNTSLRLREKIPVECVVVSESGIKTREDVAQLEQAGINAMLIGETLMRASDKQEIFRKLGV